MRGCDSGKLKLVSKLLEWRPVVQSSAFRLDGCDSGKLKRLLQNCCRVVSKNEFTRIQILPFTLKALANSSPGLRFGNPGKKRRKRTIATLKELLWFLLATRDDATPSELRLRDWNALFPQGSQSATLGWN